MLQTIFERVVLCVNVFVFFPLANIWHMDNTCHWLLHCNGIGLRWQGS